jgi:hypothetical protein
MEFLLVPGSTSKFNNKYFYPCQKFFLLPPHPDLSPPLRRRGEKRKRLLVNVIYILDFNRYGQVFYSPLQGCHTSLRGSRRQAPRLLKTRF